MFNDLTALVLAVVFVAINGLTMLAWAAQMGYKMKPTAFAFFVGSVGNALTGNVVPLSGQSSILTVSNFVKNTNERVAALLIAVVVMVVAGAAGWVSAIADWAGQPVLWGMMAGVGLMVSQISVDMLTQDKRTGAISFLTALVTFALTLGDPNQLVWVIAVSVTVATLDFLLLQKDKETGKRGRRVNYANLAKSNGFTGDMDESLEENRPWKKAYWQGFKMTKPKFGFLAVYYSLAFICINIGTNIAFGTITAGFGPRDADGALYYPLQIDTLTVINSLADIPTVLFGGMPIEAIISATAQTAWPVLAGVLMMLVLGFLCLFGLINKLVKFVPVQSLAGFLFIIGFFSTLVPQLRNVIQGGTPPPHAATGYALEAEAIVSGITAMTVTAITKNPFLGLISGVAMRYIGTTFFLFL
ncbi:MAG: xanthine/uracil permease [Oscillospiraceae bacterium]|nr:xanthine/uracil permease [Oscillospiraceae bacterium]